MSRLYEYLNSPGEPPFFSFANRQSQIVYFDDLLRSQIVYSVSAFDKLIHDVIRIGMVEIFVGRRSTTPKYLAEAISIETYNELIAATFATDDELITATLPPKEVIFEQTIVRKLKTIAYQDPIKVAEGLGYIWDEKQKWQKIAAEMALDDKTAKTTLRLIVDQRNRIVHEADIDLVTNEKYPISQPECQEVTEFLLKCGEAIVDLVSLDL